MLVETGQQFIVDFDGYEPSDRIRELISDYGIGGVILFKKNVRDADQTRRLISSLQEIARRGGWPPLFIAVDQEGGPIELTGRGFKKWPGPAMLNRSQSPEAIYKIAQNMGKELSELGVSLNFAPVLDVIQSPGSPLVRRSFGNNPHIVSKLGAAFILGMQRAGIAATAKHFPGLGRTPLDSHKVLPEISASLGELDKTDLLPFRAAIKAGVWAIMMAHVVIPAVDSIPASLSKIWIQKILRGRLKFKGLVISDSLLMQAIRARWNLPEASRLALNAGCDIMLSLGPHEEKIEAIKIINSLNKNRSRSLEKILRLKRACLDYCGKIRKV